MTDGVLIVAAVAVLVVVAIVILRRRPVLRARRLGPTDLPPGVYLMTSDGCGTCERARVTLTRRNIPYTELSWEKNPKAFGSLEIDAVPSVVQVRPDGGATWWRGGVPRRLDRSKD